jgi:EAL domain-containing protein
VFLAETEANLAILHQLRGLGVRISMDDFGTGYSSLSYLRSFPFDKIKIDRSFVKDLAERPDCVAIVCAISGLGRSLNITTTAEGVETVDQLDWLRNEGCDEVQGFLFSAAKPASEIATLLSRFANRSGRREIGASQPLARKNQTSCRAVGEKASLAIGNATLRGADAAAAIEDHAFRLDRPGFGRDGAQQRNLEFERCLCLGLVQHRLDREPHAAIEQRCRQPAMHRARRIEVVACRRDRDNDAAGVSLDDVIAERPGDRVQGQGRFGETLHEFEPRHLLLRLRVNRSIAPGRHLWLLVPFSIASLPPVPEE